MSNPPTTTTTGRVLNKSSISAISSAYRSKPLASSKSSKKKSKTTTTSSNNKSNSATSSSSDNNNDNNNSKRFTPVALPSKSSINSCAKWSSSVKSEDDDIIPTMQFGNSTLASLLNGSLAHVAIEQIGGIPSNINISDVSLATMTTTTFEKTQFTYMYDKLSRRGDALSDRIIDFGAKLIESHDLSYAQPLNRDDDSEALYVGRILNETQDGDGKLKKNSVLLEGLADTETTNSKVVRIEVSDQVQTTLFPGQIVIVKGTKTAIGTKDTVVKQSIHATQIYTGAPIRATPMPDDARMNMIAAAGPFAAYNSMGFEPLNDLLTVAKQHRPDVLLLIGPFVDCEHPDVINDQDLDLTFDDIFEHRVIEQLISYLKSDPTKTSKVVLVPSLRDVHHDFVYPQPSFNKKEWSCFKQNKEIMSRIITVSNPATFKVNSGISVGVTSNDILAQLGDKEFSNIPRQSVDVAFRRSEAILSQQSYFPLIFSSNDNIIPLDTTHYDKLGFVSEDADEAPSILILPSEMTQFCKIVQGVIVINPQHLYDKELGNGCYLQVIVAPKQAQPENVDTDGDETMGDSIRIKKEVDEDGEDQESTTTTSNGTAPPSEEDKDQEMTDVHATSIKSETITDAIKSEPSNLTERVLVRLIRL